MDAGAGCWAALKPTMSVRFWAAAWTQFACQLIISAIMGQKTSHRLQPPLREAEEHFMSVFHLRSKAHRDKMRSVGTLGGVPPM